MDPLRTPEPDGATHSGVAGLDVRPEAPALEVQLAMRSMMASMLGRVRDVEIGRYRVQRRLGQGGCGLVLLAEDPELGREVAIKVVLPARRDALDTAPDRALHREAQALARLRHPNVVEVFDAGTAEYGGDDGGGSRVGVYVVMERLVGRTLRQWLAAGPRGWREIVDVHVAVARGLGAAHTAGIVHRDCKPDNVLLTDDGRVVLIDFGLADETQAVGASSDDDATSSPGHLDSSAGSGSLTRRSRIVGTPAYMAPEQHDGHPVGPAADQYAWCVGLYAALYGAPPFRADSMSALAALKHAGRVPPPTSGPPRALYGVLRRGLAPDPARRFADMDALLAAVERARRPGGRALRWAALAGAGAVALTASVAGFRDRHPCDAAPLELGSVWTPARGEALATSLAGLPDPNAAALGTRVAQRLGTHAERWRASYDEVCATDAAPPVIVARLDCLDRTLMQLDQVATALSSIAIEDVGNAGALLEGLRAPDACSDAGAPPSAHRDELAALWRRVDELGVSVDAIGRIADPAWAEQALARADELGDAALASTIAWRLSQVARAAGELERGEQYIRTAVFRAAAAHDHARALELMPFLVLSVGSDLGDRAGAEQLLEHARVMAAGLDDARHELAAIDNAFAYVLIEKGDEDGAIALYRRSAATFAALGRPSPEYVRSLVAISGWALEHGDIDEGTTYLDRAVAVLDACALPTDSNYASIAFQYGGIAELRGELEAAARGYRDAVAHLRPRLHGHPFLGVGLFAVAIAEGRLGHFEAARAAVQEAYDLALAAHGPVHADVVRYGLMRAQLAWYAGDHTAAIAALDPTMATLPELADASDDGRRGAHHLAAWLRYAAGDVAGAERHLTVLRSMPRGDAMSGIDLGRSMRRLEALVAIRRGDLDGATRALVRPTEGPGADDYDAALEHHLDAALWDRIVAAGGARPPALAPTTAGYQPPRTLGVGFATFVRTFGEATGEPILATAARRP